MTLSIILAASQNHVIGKNNKLPWHLPADLARFKQLTGGHPVIMGRKTHESIGRALPNRTNIVITSNPDYEAPGCICVGSLGEALKKAANAKGAEEVFVLGGRRVFEEALPKADKIYLTRIKADVDGDVRFEFDQKPWETMTCEKHAADEQNPYPYNFVLMVRKSYLHPAD